MKLKILLAVIVSVVCASAQAQVNSGSNGSDGAFNPTSSTVINMADHPNGIYQYTYVNIPSGVMVTFIPNANNTPVTWLVQGNCVINGTVEMCGAMPFGTAYPSYPAYQSGGIGGPGGGAGGNGGNNPTSGQGPGGGSVPAGSAGYGTTGWSRWGSGQAGNVYGNSSLIPLLGGSGGGGGGYWASGGGGGGGAILIYASGTIQLNGLIDVHGSTGFYSGGGSSGGVRLIALNFNGTGNINASSNTDGGGAGRVRADVVTNNFTGQIAGTFTQGSPLSPLTIVQTNRVPTTNEITPRLAALPTTSQLLAYHGGIFTPNLASVDPNQPTIVLTHGWIPTLAGIDLYPPVGVASWPTTFAAQLRANGVFTGNIVAWDWSLMARSPVDAPGIPEQQTGDQGQALGQALLLKLGANYSKPIQFIGHSLGTLVNASAANYLHGDRWAQENVSPTPWPGTNTLMTLFDEAEVARGNSSFAADIDTLQGRNGNPLLPSKSTDHPLPKQFAWAENYIAAFGLLQTNAANVILTNKFPANANNPVSWFENLAAFHGYPYLWYEPTIQTDNSEMGFVWSYLWSLNDPAFANAPTNGSVYVQADNTSPWNLTLTNWNYGTNLLAARFQEYRNGLFYSLTGETLDQATVNGIGNGQNVNVVGPLAGWQNFNVSIFTTPANVSPAPQIKVHPLGLTPNDAGGNTNIPAYAWMSLAVPVNAVSMSFDYIIQGDWQSDSLAAAFNGTNVLSLPGSQIETNVLFGSGSIDVSAFAGQTNEFFIGIVGGTSTNAQLTVENLVFSIPSPPSMQAQASGNNCVLSWPLSAADYTLETSTDLISWTVVTNVPAIVNLQNAVTNPASDGARFFRLMK